MADVIILSAPKKAGLRMAFMGYLAAGALTGMIFGLVAMGGWMYKVPLFSVTGLIPATSSAFIISPLAFPINIAVSYLMAEKFDRETRARTNAIMRKLHNLTGQVEEEVCASAFAH